MIENTIQHSLLLRTKDYLTYRDLNKNGKLDVYEDHRQPIEARVEDLLGQMTLEEKAGLMFINGVAVNEDGPLEEKPIARVWTGSCDSNHTPADEPFQPLANPGGASSGEMVQPAPAFCRTNSAWRLLGFR